MDKSSIDPFDQFYCMSRKDSHISFSVSEIFRTYGDKTCIRRQALHKFGENPTVGTVQAPVSSWGQFEEYQTSNIVLNISSSSASDTGEITIEHMTIDGSNNLTFGTQTVTLQGQTPVALPTAACRWTRMISATAEVGDVYIYRGTATNGVPDDLTKVHNQIRAGFSQSQKAATSIASSNYFVMTTLWADILKKANASAIIYFRVRQLGEDFKVRPKRGVDSSHALNYKFDPYEIIRPNSDIEVYAEALSGSDNDITAGFDGYLADIIS